MKKLFTSVLFSLFATTMAVATNYYISTTGSDSNDGLSRETAFATIAKAQSIVVAGDNVYILPGTYNITEDQISKEESPYKIVFNFNQSGSYGKPISFIGLTESGSRPVFDMSAVNPTGYRITAFYVTGQYLVFRNFEVIGMMVNITDHTQSENFRIRNGKHNTFDNIACHDGMGIGFYLTNNSSHNLFLNCDGYNNYDSVSEDGKGGQNDAFGCHVTEGNVNNIFIGCRAWNNSDDGYDLINCFSPVTFCYSIAYKNGYDADGNKRQDGNGFKAGGYGMSESSVSLPSDGAPRHKVYHCLAVENKSNGIYSNHHLGGLDFTYNTSVNNGAYNFNMVNRKGASSTENEDVNGYDHNIKNNLVVASGNKYMYWIDATDGQNTIENNSFAWSGSEWTNSYDATFVSTNVSRLTRARKSDGMLDSSSTLTVYQQNTYTGMGCDFSGYEDAITAAKEISGAEMVVKADEVTEATTWSFDDLSAGTIDVYYDYNDLILRGTSGSHAITVNSDGSVSFAANGANIASYLNNDKTAADNLNNTTYDRCLAFNAGVPGTTTAVFSASSANSERYFQIYFKAEGKDKVVEQKVTAKEQTTVSLTSTEPGTFFICSTLACKVHEVSFTPTSTGIAGVSLNNNVAAGNDVLYSITGQRVSNSYRGIVIMNGRKFFKRN